MNIVITGGCGFIGSHIVDRLAEIDDITIIVIDNLSSGTLDNIKKHIGRKYLHFFKVDLKEREKVLEIMRNFYPDIIFHFAANPDVRSSVLNPLDHFENNVVITLNLLEVCRKIDFTGKFIFASSSTVYGDACIIPTPEESIPRPISIYGACKASCEMLIHSYSSLYDIKSIILRYANIIGPRLRHGVVYDFVVKLLKNPSELEILGDGSQRKSYLYIDDAVDITLKIAFEEKDKYAVYNIGNEDWITVLEIADIVCSVLNVRPKYIFRKTVKNGRGWLGDVKNMLLDISKVKRKFKWKPKYDSRKAVKLTAETLVNELKQIIIR